MEALSNNAPCVVVVDDDPAARDSFGALLQNAGYDVHLFESCERFLMEATQHQPACMLLDARFPGMSGLGLLDALREAGLTVRTVFVMGRFDASTRARAQRHPNVVRVLDKPMGANEIVDAVRRAIGA